ncbi:MAG: response regulator [Bacteroidales bacterium]|nr:response regulator [Bacteroidales bacterium]
MNKNHSQNSPVIKSSNAEYNWSDYTILIAEDENTNFVYLETALLKTNAKILHAKNGKEAVELTKVNPQIDLILMDIKMPVMNGLEATRSIKSFRKDIIIIAQTAFAMEEDRRNCIAVGCDDFLPKPIRYTFLIETLAKYLK